MDLARKTRHTGFTLLEVLTAVGMVTVVTAVALPAHFRTVERGRQAEARLVLSLIRASELRYEAEQQTFTTAWNDLDIEDPSPQSTHFVYTLDDADATNFHASAARTISNPPPYRLVIDRSGRIDEVAVAVEETTVE